MTYIVLTRFADLQDGNRIYEAGDNYPRPGFDVSDERLAELAGSDNRIGKPLIRPVRPVETPEELNEEIPAQTVNPAKKPRRSRQKG